MRLKSSLCPLPLRIPNIPQPIARMVCKKPYLLGSCSSFLLLRSFIRSTRRRNTVDGPGDDSNDEGNQSQSGVPILAALFCRHTYFTTGGVSNGGSGAGEGTDHASPVAPSQACAGAGSPILREALITNHRKISCEKPHQNAPMVASMLKSVSCAA